MRLTAGSVVEQITQSFWKRALFFLAAAFACILLIGYHFGTFDQIVHLPFLKAAANPALYPGDPFVQMGQQSISFFWSLFLPFVRFGGFEIAVAVTHLLVTCLTFWSFWELSLALFGSPPAACLSVLLFIIPHTGFVGFPVIEFSLLNRTAALPLALFAITLYLRKRPVLAFFLLGAASNLHFLTAAFTLAWLLPVTILDRTTTGWRKILLAAAAFLAAAAPQALLMAGKGVGLDWSLRPEWLGIISNGTIYTIFHLLSANPIVFFLDLGGAASLALLVIAWRRTPSSQHAVRLKVFLWASLSLAGISIIAAELLPVTWILKLQLSRATSLLLILIYLSFAFYLVELIRRAETFGKNWLLLTGFTLFGLSPLLPLMAWKFIRWLNKPLSTRWVCAAIGLLIAVEAVFCGQIGLWSPGIYVFPRSSAWVEVQIWARDHTPLNATFIAPPYLGGIYESGWRVFSERGQLAALTDLLEIALAPDYLPAWQDRFAAIAPGAIEQFRGNFFENMVIVHQAYDHLQETDFLQAAKRYQASYVVVEKPKTLHFPLLFENQGFSVYQVP